MKHAFFFDFDGTLVDSERLGKQAWDEVWYRLTSTHLTDELRAFMTGKTHGQRAEYLCQAFQLALTPQDLRLQVVERFDALVATQGLPLMPGAREALVRTRADGHALALASNSNRAYVDRMLALLDLQSFFDAIVTRDDVSHPKPAPDIYLDLLRRYPDHQAIAVEDSLTGIASALEARLPVLGVIGGGSLDDVRGSTYTLPSLELFDPAALISLLYPHV